MRTRTTVTSPLRESPTIMSALTSHDSMFLATEDGRTVANVCSLAIMHSPTPTETP